MSEFREKSFAYSKSSQSTFVVEYASCPDIVEYTEEEQNERTSVPVFDFPRKQSSSGSSATTASEKPKSQTSFLEEANLDTCLIPFYLRWSFGVGLSTAVINLTIKRRPSVYYAASHAGVIYNYATKEMRLLQGHKNLISGISADDSGKWLVSADKGEDNTIIVWDSQECVPVNTIFNPHPGCGTAVVGISGNAKYLATVGNEHKPVFNFWLWTYGNDQPDDSYKIESGGKHPVKICFNPNVQEHVMVAFKKQIVFFEWDPANNKLLPPEFPTIKNIKNLGHITDCAYVDKCHECVACTNEGYVLVFGSTFYALPYEETPLKNNKIFAKPMKISSVGISCIASVDGVIVTGDTRGHIKFYDKKIRILFWCQNFSLPPITSISFNLEQRICKLKDALDFTSDSFENMDCNLKDCQCEDRSEEYERLYVQLVPSDATLKRLPFVVRDFVIATDDGRIASVDYVRNKCNFFFKKADAPVTSIDAHDEKPYLIVGYANGKIRLYNHETREMLIEETLPEEADEYTETLVAVTCIKYSPQSLFLACGRESGSVWFLNAAVLSPKFSSPFCLTRGKDENFTVVIMKYLANEERWEFLGKLRPHYKPIRDILFTSYLPSRFFSIGDDRYLVEYDLNESFGNLELINRERIEQIAIPLSFIYAPMGNNAEDKYLLMSDNQFKYKLVHDKTYMCRSVVLGPAYGCYKDSPVKKMAILPNHYNQYLIFANDNQFGIQALPADGNPYRFVGTTGHPTKLLDFCICSKGKYIFTIGEGDNCVLMWEANLSSVDTMTKLGGVELEPYYCLIEGGIKGWLFKEMQDLFYYMQVLHQGENTVLPRIVTDHIPVAELPDLMRAAGFYPSEYEIENIMVDVRYRNYDETKTLVEEVSFLDFVKLYINHRPAHGVSIKALRDAFETFCVAGEGPGPNCMTSSSFVAALCERGEMFSLNKAHTCLATLMHAVEDDDDDMNKDFSFLPEQINFEVFLEAILGMDLERQPMEEEKPGDVEAEEQDLC